MVARLSRIVPLLIVLAIVAAVVYLAAMFRYSPNRAKEILISLFTWLTGILSGIFFLASAYAWFDGNGAVLDLTLSFLVAALVALCITRLCWLVFVRRHPQWRKKPEKAKRLGSRGWSWRR